ncbi:hypothetical protein FG386_000374 [Cryptosporidium ryanae]|uniref:uncharacterized protein n=1 Tax=Cryptosporidium ryanae TaxID=515981 RepID=UPI00351A2D02|nr:hypothetical protein FG386_000374 [Cryptosporidium ryanae]
MDFIKDIINLYMKRFLQLEDLKWDLKEGIQIEHLKINSKGINEQFQQRSIPFKVDNGTLESIKISYSPKDGFFHVHIREIQAQISPQVLSTVGKKIQRGLVNIILDEDPVEFIDSYSYIRDLPISYLEQTKKRVESTAVDPSLIPEPPKYPVPAYKLNNQPYVRKCSQPPAFYPPPILDGRKIYNREDNFTDETRYLDSTRNIQFQRTGIANPTLTSYSALYNLARPHSTPIFKTNKGEGRSVDGFYNYC